MIDKAQLVKALLKGVADVPVGFLLPDGIAVGHLKPHDGSTDVIEAIEERLRKDAGGAEVVSLPILAIYDAEFWSIHHRETVLRSHILFVFPEQIQAVAPGVEIRRQMTE